MMLDMDGIGVCVNATSGTSGFSGYFCNFDLLIAIMSLRHHSQSPLYEVTLGSMLSTRSRLQSAKCILAKKHTVQIYRRECRSCYILRQPLLDKGIFRGESLWLNSKEIIPSRRLRQFDNVFVIREAETTLITRKIMLSRDYLIIAYSDSKLI